MKAETRSTNRKHMEAYLEFIQKRSGNGKINFVKHQRSLINKLVIWMDHKQLNYAMLTSSHYEEFQLESKKTRKRHIRAWARDQASLKIFMGWLSQDKRTNINVSQIFPGYKPRRDKFRYSSEVKLPKPAIKFLKVIESTRSKGTAGSYRMQLKSFAHFCKLKKISSTRFSRSEVVQYLEYIQNVKKWSPESRAVAIVLMRAYLKWAFENRFIKKQPDSLLSNKDRPKLCQPLPKPLAREIDSEILRRVSGSSDIYHKQIYVIRQTGMRVGEACSLSQDCLFEVNSKTKYSLKVPVGKNRKERLVPINADCIQVIQAIQKKNRKRNCKYLFQNEMGKRIKEPELRSVFNSLVSDIPSENPITIHRLRHTYATEMVDASLNLQSLAVILGHSNIASTLRYSAVTDQSIGNDYHKSIEIIKDLYGDVHLVESSNSQERKNGRDMLTLAWKCLKKEFADKQITHQPNVRNFLERLSRLSENLGDLQNTDIK